MQQYPDILWEWPFESWWPVSRIRDQFCSCYDLDTTAFCLYCGDALLCMDGLISEVGGHADQPGLYLPNLTAAILLQVHQENKETCQYSDLVLTARFVATIPFYAWYSLQQEEYPDPAALATAWQADVQGLVRRLQDVFSIGRSEAETAEAMVKACCHVAFTEGTGLLTTPFKPAKGFTDVPAQQELQRSLLDKLMLSARYIRRKSEGLPPESAQGEDYPVFAAWQASDADSKDSGMKYTRLLQSMLLLWELAWTAMNVSATAQTPESETAITTLIEAVGGLCDRLKRYDQAADDRATTCPPQTVTTEEAGAAAKTAAEIQAEIQTERHKSLSLMFLISVKRRLPLVVDGQTPEAEVCCNIMSALMMKSQPSIYQAVAKAIVAKGEIPTTSSARQDVVDVLDDHCT